MEAIASMAISLAGLFFFVWGIILAFRASIILGIVSLLISPAAVVFGIVMLLFKRDLAQELVDYFTNR